MNNLSTVPHDDARPEMDEMLRDYFHSEMPKPWPAFRTPKPARAKRSVTFWSRSSGRLALAACVALLMAGYWTLGGYFPNASQSTNLEQVVRPIGQKGDAKKAKSLIEPEKAPMPMPMEN